MSLALLVFTLLAIALVIAGLNWLIRHSLRAPRIPEQGSPAQRGLAYQTVSIPAVRNKQLFGWYIPAPDNARAPAVAVLHGWGSNAEMMLPVAAPLNQAGYAVLLFDARCHGRSDDDNFASLPRFAEDLDCALAWLVQQPGVDAANIAVLGHSVGAGAVLLAASRRKDIAAVISVAAFSHPASMMRRFLAARHVPYMPLGWYVMRYVQRIIGHRFDAIAPRHTITQIRCPVLLVHGSDDTIIPVSEAREIHAQRRSDAAQLLILPGEHDSSAELERHADKLLAFLNQATRTGV
ncbi:alpha/beta hydrolase [Sulfuriferula sp. GW1]|uniref:alpha/beta hydrolase n=1 Tax=Sulfuriferula sp. GW1 TaxID=3345111 RepID=UPI0039B08AAF